MSLFSGKPDGVERCSMAWSVVRQLANLLIAICILLTGASSLTFATPRQENTLPLKLLDRSALDESAVKLQEKNWQWRRISV
ncbi:TPA: hypothetical protein L4T35_000934 [Pseudomonas aeruginosa]|uniref:hypothetical protein n=1 Tax=Pseudomonas aeruginosa TaxID=287 RepID=UPI0015E2D026|nr:hypothetical protein [Pseudomonas aeruginosa]HBO3681027.1 hypothetical protein [Pseudomonas aeruginosa]